MDLLRYSFSDCLQTVYRVWTTHFRELLVVCAIPSFLLYSLETYREFTGGFGVPDSTLWDDLWGLVVVFVQIVIAGATSLAVSDICLGAHTARAVRAVWRGQGEFKGVIQ